ncbi:ABC transporter substrate-binding protein [Georgenia yuyongxinii]|uniref:ABC transporter substrate-binding protein n=2 Tax=Georgenia yuyongxinii TaxID=2589797 RepID=A0A552WXT0_9MICO|nr:ABC transporter substrate-binding protein [Georgenia yuyongxinii]
MPRSNDSPVADRTFNGEVQQMIRRRQKMTGVAAVAALATMGLAACGGGNEGTAAAEGASTEMVFTGAGGSYQEAQTVAFIEPFQEETGITVAQDQPYSLAKVKTMVESGRTTWDVMEVDPYLAMGENCGKYFEVLDLEKIDTTGVEPELITECSMPDMKSAYLFVYNKDTYPEAPTSWMDFFDVEKFPGTRGIMDYPDQGALEIALIADGVAPEDLYPLDIDRALAKLDTIRDTTTYLTTGAEQQEALESGAVDMMLSWPGRAYGAAQNGANLGTVWNQAMLYWDGMAIPKGSTNLDAAHQFISFSIAAGPQATLTENTAYAPINTDAKPEVDPLKEQFLPLGQDGGTAFLRDMGYWAEHMDEAVNEWTAWTTG